MSREPLPSWSPSEAAKGGPREPCEDPLLAERRAELPVEPDRFYQHMIETKVMLGPNPAADLKWFQGRKREAQTSGNVPFFTVEEMPKVLDAFRALHPRWYPFVLTSFLGGLRFGEIAALHRDDLDVKRGLLNVVGHQRGQGRPDEDELGAAREGLARAPEGSARSHGGDGARRPGG